MATRKLFVGDLSIEQAPVVKNDCTPCGVCGQPIPFKGIRILGEVMNPLVIEQETARWRLGTDTHFLKDPELAKRNIPATNQIDIFVHDVICLAVFFRDRLNSPTML